MLRSLFFAVLVLKCAYVSCESCKADSCDECIQNPNCLWCTDTAATEKCQDRSKTNCPKENILNPEAKIEESTQNGASNAFSPAGFKMQLRKGEQTSITFAYTQPANLPVDLYYLFDVSASMKSNKENLAKLGDDIIKGMQSVTSDLKIGFGTFVDKVTLPYVSTQPEKLKSPCKDCVMPYSFKNGLKLSDGQNFAELVRNTRLSGNVDSPEGGFDALMQVMVCESEIGWRNGTTHLIVFATDEGFHVEGDGKLAGIIVPNDAKCHMKNNAYTHDLILDYPSIGQLARLSNDMKYNLFFNIVKGNGNVYAVYEDISKKFNSSQVAELKPDSNLVEQIANFTKQITKQLEMKINDTSNFKVEFLPIDCPNNAKTSSGCSNVQSGNKIQFEANITALSCGKNSFTIQPTSYSSVFATLTIEAEVICSCNCKEQADLEINSATCGFRGDLLCSACSCNEGYSGSKCECYKSNADSNSAMCETNGVICNGHGDCDCEKCKCHEGFGGDKCECDNTNCQRKESLLCNDQGICTCSKCECYNGWGGDDCGCAPDTDCSINGTICNNNGYCKCGKCKCNSAYSGEFCEECYSCNKCDEIKPCIECKVQNTTDCTAPCSKYSVTFVDSVQADTEVMLCKLTLENDCVKLYTYRQINDFEVEVQDKEECEEPIHVAGLIGGIIGLILLIGLLTLLIWKLSTWYIDRREYAKFEDEQQKSKWHADENPLFKSPVTQFKNPAYPEQQPLTKSESLNFD